MYIERENLRQDGKPVFILGVMDGGKTDHHAIRRFVSGLSPCDIVYIGDLELARRLHWPNDDLEQVIRDLLPVQILAAVGRKKSLPLCYETALLADNESLRDFNFTHELLAAVLAPIALLEDLISPADLRLDLFCRETSCDGKIDRENPPILLRSGTMEFSRTFPCNKCRRLHWENCLAIETDDGRAFIGQKGNIFYRRDDECLSVDPI